MGERQHGRPPREERQRCSCRAATSQAAECGRSPLPVTQEVSKGEAARRLIAREASVSAGANTSSFEAQLCNFSFFFPTERNKKKKKKTFQATIRSWLLTLNQNLLDSFILLFSLIVTNARNVKYIKLNIYIKRFWTSYYHYYNSKEKESTWTQIWSASLEIMNEACWAKKHHKVLFVPTRFTLSPSEGGVQKSACCQLVLWEK